jgi:two-component system cell cycle sensor histidine kinase/response regulator CckA
MSSDSTRHDFAPLEASVFRQLLFDQALDGVAILTPAGSVYAVNAAFASHLGYTVAEMTPFHVWDWDAQWTRDQLLAKLQDLVRASGTFDTRHRRRDGSLCDVEVSVNHVRHADSDLLCCVHRDTTERKRVEEALRESEERLARIFHSSSNAIAFSEPTRGVILDVNETWERASGYARAEAIGRTALDLGLWADAEDRDRCLASLEAEGRVLERDVRLNMGSPNRPFQVSAEYVEIRGVRYVLWEFHDISARKQAEEEQARLAAQLVQAQKMEAVGQLAGGVAHDFNNLLQVISGYTELALEDLELTHPARQTILEVTNATSRAMKLISQLLAFSRRQIIKPEDLDLNEVIGAVLDMVERLIGEHIRLDFIRGHHLGTVRADRTMVEQVLLNLCVNARDAMGAGGRLTIETGNVLVDADFCATNPWARPGRYVLLVVSDDGHGMDPDTLSHAFEPFFTTKGTGKGSGLGLSMVYGIIRQHGGMVRAYSEPGKGSAFKVYLPAVERRAQHVIFRGEAPLSGGTETILLAEDDASVRALAERVLRGAGYTVLSAATGTEASSIFEQHADRVDLLLLDVVMPGLGGREVFDRARRLNPDIAALFASGYTENAIHTDFVLKDEMNLIPKPYSLGGLLRAVRARLDARRTK